MGLDFDELFPNRFMKAGEFKGRDVTLTISGVKVEVLEGDKGKETKGILSFEKTPKQLVINKTNGLCLRAMFGRDTGAWVGRRVTFFPAAIDFGDVDLAIRVRGSPDIAADMDVEIKLARKKPRTMRMLRTGQKPAQQKAAPQVPPAESKPADVHHFDKPATNPMHDPAAEPPDEAFDAQTGELTM